MIVFEAFNRKISLSTNILFMNLGKSFSKKPCNIWRSFIGKEINLRILHGMYDYNFKVGKKINLILLKSHF